MLQVLLVVIESFEILVIELCNVCSAMHVSIISTICLNNHFRAYLGQG